MTYCHHGVNNFCITCTIHIKLPLEEPNGCIEFYKYPIDTVRSYLSHTLRNLPRAFETPFLLELRIPLLQN